MKRFSAVMLVILITAAVFVGCSDPSKETLCFIGDSITEQYKVDNYFKEYNAVNKGNYGEASPKTLARTDKVLDAVAADYVFLLIGTNDLSFGCGIDGIAENITAIAEKISARPNVRKLFVLSVLPLDHKVRPRYAYYNNEVIQDLNGKIESSIADIDKAVYVDMYSLLIDNAGDLNSEYTTDGLHISGKGYDVITEQLKSVLLDCRV